MPEISEIHRPLSETIFYILLSIAADQKHGYAILKDVQLLSQDRVILSTGTSYGALSRLPEQGLIERVGVEKPEEVGRPRKFYTLTQPDYKVLEAEIMRLRALVNCSATPATIRELISVETRWVAIYTRLLDCLPSGFRDRIFRRNGASFLPSNVAGKVL